MPAKKQTLKDAVAALEERLHGHQLALDGIDARLDALNAKLEELVELRQLALEAAAQAQDAVNTTSRVADYEARLNMLTLAVAEGIQHVDRAEKRIQATVGRARRQLEDAGLDPHPGLEAEAAQLQLLDGGGGEERRVPAVPQDVDDDEEVVELRGVPGRFTKGTLRRMHGG